MVCTIHCTFIEYILLKYTYLIFTKVQLYHFFNYYYIHKYTSKKKIQVIQRNTKISNDFITLPKIIDY